MDQHRVQMGERIVRARRERGWNAARLAQEARVAPNTLSSIERGLGYQDGSLGKVLAVLPEVKQETAATTDYPADVEMARDWLGAHLVALSPEDRRDTVNAMVAHLISRSLARQGHGVG